MEDYPNKRASRPVYFNPIKFESGHIPSHCKCEFIPPQLVDACIKRLLTKKGMSTVEALSSLASSYGAGYISESQRGGTFFNMLEGGNGPVLIPYDNIPTGHVLFFERGNDTNFDEIANSFGGMTIKLGSMNELKVNPKATITFKNVLVRGNRCYRLTAIENIKEKEDLPIKYIEGNTSFYLVKTPEGRKSIRLKNIQVNSEFSPGVTINMDETVSIEMKGWIIRTMKKAAENLREVNKTIDKLKEEWEGKEEIIKV